MQTFSTIIGAIIVLLVLAAIITIFKYPKDILIKAPIAVLKSITLSVLWYVRLIISPVWVPFWVLDKIFKWGIFEYRFFKIFSGEFFEEPDEDEQPDIEYPATQRRKIAFHSFTKFLITSEKNADILLKVLVDGLESIGGENKNFRRSSFKNFCVAQNDSLDLYQFHYLIHWMDNEMKGKNYGFAQRNDFSFFGMVDASTLNNVIGKTSQEEIFAFNLTGVNSDNLCINPEIPIKTKFTTRFFDRLILQTKSPENSNNFQGSGD
jgi:hypothetical protein